jgi:hypothetical protein
VSGNLIANNDTQIKIIGRTSAYREVQDIHIHHNHIHQADDGGEGFDASFAYGQGVLIQYAKRVHLDHNNFVGLRDYGVKAIGCLEGVFIDHNYFRAGNQSGVVFDLVQWGRINSNEFVGHGGTAVLMYCNDAGNYNQNNRVVDNGFQGNAVNYSENPRTRANYLADNLGGTLNDYVLSTALPLTQVRHVSQAGNQQTFSNQQIVINGGTWNTARLILGNQQLWVDAAGKLRIKNSNPTGDTDGVVVGAQT